MTAEPTVAEEVRAEFDLPELADTLEEADARVEADKRLFILKMIQKERDTNEAEYKALMEHHKEAQESRQAALDGRIAFLTNNIEALFGMMDPGKKKSLNLLGGTIGHRKQQDELVVEDDMAVIKWFGSQLPIVRTKYEVDRKLLRSFLESKPPSQPLGVSLVKRPPVFYARPK